VLNFPERVRPDAREKVLATIKSLDYTPNLAARRLRSARASSIAVRLDTNAVTEGEQRGLYSGFIQDEFVYQLTKAAQERGIKVITYTAGDQDEEIEKLRFLLNSQDADGLILTSTTGNDPRLKLLNEKKVPFMTFGRPWGAANLYSTKNLGLMLMGPLELRWQRASFGRKGIGRSDLLVGSLKPTTKQMLKVLVRTVIAVG
jgi:DNA-binding LacI/PurR family transcriptional regulator